MIVCTLHHGIDAHLPAHTPGVGLMLTANERSLVQALSFQGVVATMCDRSTTFDGETLALAKLGRGLVVSLLASCIFSRSSLGFI
jgi:hypothetical protein